MGGKIQDPPSDKEPANNFKIVVETLINSLNIVRTNEGKLLGQTRSGYKLFL